MVNLAIQYKKGELRPMGEIGTHSDSELAYVVFADLVSYSTLPIESQIEITNRFKALVRDICALDEPSGALALDSGDGVALVYFGGSSRAIEDAIKLARELKALDIGARMGIHCGPITRVEDVNGQMTVVGPAINMAERVQSSADPGQVLLSGAAADAAAAHGQWRSYLEDLGEHEVKHGVKLRLVNLVAEGCGVSGMSERLKQRKAESERGRIRSNLPVSLTSFVGRSSEIDNLQTYLKHARLVTLLGPGGIGKTRLSIESASRVTAPFPDGAWFVGLDSVQDGKLVAQEVAGTFGVGDSGGIPVMERLASILIDQELLLILDNCEHLLADSAFVARFLLDRCPRVTILATSREPLGLPGELVVKVRSLSTPKLRPNIRVKWLDQGGAQIKSFEAVRLFLDRATHANPSFRVTDSNLGTVCQITSRLDGIPLAIELAASRVRMMTAEQIWDRLDNAFSICKMSSTNIHPRHQTLRATIDWSYNLLSKEDRLLFERLAVFTGSFSLEAVEFVPAFEPISVTDILDGVQSLVDKSLILSEESHGQMRYRMLETVRQYSQELLQESSDSFELRGRHLQFYAKLGAEARDALRTSEQMRLRHSIELDLDNVRTALEWALTGGNAALSAARLACDVFYYWFEMGHFSEASGYLERVRAELTDSAPASLRVKVIVYSGALSVYMGDRAGLSLMRAGLAIAEAEEPSLILFATSWLGDCHYLVGEDDAAYDQLTRALGLAEEIGDTKRQNFMLLSMAAIASGRGDYDVAESLILRMLRTKEEENDPKGMGLAHCHLAHLYLTLNRPEASRHYKRGVALIGSPPDYYLLGGNLSAASMILLEADDFVGAAKIQGFADRLLDQTGAIPDKLFVRIAGEVKERTRNGLSRGVYDSAYLEGRRLSLREALEMLGCDEYEPAPPMDSKSKGLSLKLERATSAGS